MYSPPSPGVYTPVPTFFKKDGSLDIETQIKHARFLKENGIKGIVLMGSTGEATHLTRTERAFVISSVSREFPDWTIIAGVAQGSVQDAIDEIESVKKAGAEYVLIGCAAYFGKLTSQAGIFDYYTAVASKSALPMILYIYPGVYNGLLAEPETCIALSANPMIVGCKFSFGDIPQHNLVAENPSVQKNSFSVFTGLGQILLPAMMAGAKGTIDALSAAFPKQVVALYDLIVKQRYEEAARLQYTVAGGEYFVSNFGPVGTKKLVYSQGFGESFLGRVPLNHPPEDAEWNKLHSYFEACQKCERSL